MPLEDLTPRACNHSHSGEELIIDIAGGREMDTIADPGNQIFIYLIVACALVIILLVAERVYSVLIKRRVNTDELVKEVLICIEAREFEGAIELCDRSIAPINQILSAGLKAYNNNFNHNEEIARNNTNSEITFSTSPDTFMKEDTIKRAMDEVAVGAYSKLRRGTGYLPMLVKLVLLIGVTGTIFGMMNVLGWKITSIDVPTESILAGISRSLFTTLVGLFIAIPTVLAHSFISHRALYTIEDAEEASLKVLNALLKR